MGFNGDQYPLVIIKIAFEAMAQSKVREFSHVSHGGSFHSHENVYQRIMMDNVMTINHYTSLSIHG